MQSSPCPVRRALLATSALTLLCATPARAVQSQHEIGGALELDWESWLATQRSSDEEALDVEFYGTQVFVAGRSRQMNSSWGRWLAFCYEHDTGAETWRAEFPADVAHGQEAVGLAISDDATRVFVTGKLAPSSGWGSDLGIVAYDLVDGAVLWSATLAGTGPQYPKALAGSADNSAVFVTGADGQRLLVLARAHGDGAPLWSTTYDGGGYQDLGLDLAVNLDGSAVYVTGRSEVASQGGGVTLAYSAATGAPLWDVTETASIYLGELRTVAVANDGSAVFAAGELGTADDIYAYNPVSGALLWSAPFDNVAPFGGGVVDLVVEDDSSRLYLTGTIADANGETNLRTLCLDAATGSVHWSMEWDAPAAGEDTEEAAGLALAYCTYTVQVTGTSRSPGGSLDWATVSYDMASGAKRWERLHDGPDGGDDASRAVAAGSMKVYVAGRVDAGVQEGDLALRTLSAQTGADEWERTVDLQVQAQDMLRDLAVAPDGARVFVAGEACCSQGAETVALDTTSGAELWRATLLTDEQSNAQSIAAAPSGTSVYSAGQLGDGSYLAGYAAADGAQQWLTPFAGTPWASPNPVRIAASPDGLRVYSAVTTGTEDSTTHDYLTTAWDAASGTPLWTRVHDPVGSVDEPSALALAPDGSAVYVTGTSAPTTWTDFFGFIWPNHDFGTVAYDAVTGTPLWTSYYHGGPGNQAEQAVDVAVAPDGSRVFVTGIVESSAPPDMLTVAYDASGGNELWTALYHGTGTDAADPAALAVDPLGSRVYVAGTHRIGFATQDNLAVVAYDLVTGVELWRNAPVTGTADQAVAIGVEPDGSRVYVTGWRRDASGAGSGADYLTRVYEAASGTLLGEAVFAGPNPPWLDDSPQALAVDPNGRRLFVGGQSASPGGLERDATVLSYGVPYFSAMADSISLSAGGDQTLNLTADPALAGKLYLVLGGLAGATPGFPVNGVWLPLQVDPYTVFTVQFANVPPFSGTLGTLGATGHGSAAFEVQPGTNPGYAGLTLYHAYLVFDVPGFGWALLASNSVSLTLNP